MVKQTTNNKAAVEKSAGKINTQTMAIGHNIGNNPILKSLITTC
jgi:hypothetical protein